MSSIGYCPLFCTIPQLPIELAEKLITETRDVDAKLQNCFVIVASPEQQDLIRGLRPVTEPIPCGFVGADIEHLAHVPAQKFNYFSSDENSEKVNWDMFVVIDERSLKDGTLRIVQSDLGPIYDEPSQTRMSTGWEP